jgi:thioredoxin 1
VAQLAEITDSTFDAEVLQSDRPVLVDFWAPWCGPCRALGKTLEEVAAERGDQIKIVKVNIDEEQQHAAALGVMMVPTVVLYKDGKVVDKLQGGVPPRQVAALIDRHVGVAAD